MPGKMILLGALVLALAGCAVPGRAPEPAPPPPVHVPESVWWQVDSDIDAASLAAKGIAREYALDAMKGWLDLVRRRTEADFVPWFTGYWTQQWLSAKMAWYKLNAGEDRDRAFLKFSAYLEEKYRDRVLEPVAREIDPNAVRQQATILYVRSLGERIRGIPQRYGVPPDQFDRRLKDIPAIAPQPAFASLYQVIHADPLDRLPAYEALMGHMSGDAGKSGIGSGEDKVSPIAKWTGEKLEDRFAVSGGASAAATVIGGVLGKMLSLAATGFGAMAHESGRPEMEVRLRKNLQDAMDGLWHVAIEDTSTGVMAGVYSISGKIEEKLSLTRTQPVKEQSVPQEIPLSGR